MGLKEKNPDIRIALTDPHGAALYYYYAHGELKSEGSSVAEGIGQGRITANLEGAPIDTQFRISDEEGDITVAEIDRCTTSTELMEALHEVHTGTLL